MVTARQINVNITLPEHVGMCYVNSSVTLTGDLVHVTSTYVDILRTELISANL